MNCVEYKKGKIQSGNIIIWYAGIYLKRYFCLLSLLSTLFITQKPKARFWNNLVA